MLVSWALMAAPVFAFDLGDCPTQPFDTRALEQLQAQFAEQLTSNHYADIFLALQYDAEKSALWSHDERTYKNLLQALKILNERFANFDQALAKVDDKQAFETFLANYPSGLFQCCNRTYFSGLPIQVTFDELETLPGERGEDKAKDFLFRAQTVDRLLNQMKKSSREATIQGIRNAAM